MLFKGIILILIGLSGIVITLIWTFKSFGKTNKDKSCFSHDTQEDSYYTTEMSEDIEQKQRILNKNIKPLGFSLKAKEAESTILLDDLVVNEYTDETVLLDEEKLKL